MPFCAGDSLTLSVNLLSLQGALKPGSVVWAPITSRTIPPESDFKDYNRVAKLTPNRDMLEKYFADLSRVCEVEDTVVEWFDYDAAISMFSHRQIDISQYREQFSIQAIEIGGIDFSVLRLQLEARKPSETVEYDDLKMQISVKEGPVNNEVKRAGLLIDKGCDLEVSPGDQLVVYVSMGGSEK